MHCKLLANNILEHDTILFVKINSEICKTLYKNIVKNHVPITFSFKILLINL